MGTNGDKMTGAVLVQGGGIAGVQASLDLANSGFKVYLIERSAAIGGMMAHLDKTFPTGDCATCIVSPKLVECARNQNIEILTLSELTGLEGGPGRFTATIRRHPRYVDEDKCTGCSECTAACPVDVADYFNRDMGTRKGIAKLYPQAVPNIFGILKHGHAPCKMACPAHVNVQGYIQLIKKKEYAKALALIRQRNPFSAICGRVCTHPCEEACTRGGVDEALAVRLLKRFVSDKEMEMLAAGEITMPAETSPPADAKKVAVIGAGPAGLTAAGDLAERGFAVTVYDALPEAGGMLRWGIPAYRLPHDILRYEIDLIRRKGVTLVLNCRVGRDKSLQEIESENDAVFVSVGVHQSRKLGVEGEDLPGIFYGVEFLRQANAGDETPRIRGKVVVIGGGNVAVDVARTVRRRRADSVEMICLEPRDQMPASPEEVEATLQEGITIHNGWGPKRILGASGGVSGIELKRCTRVFDEEGRFRPVYEEQETLTVDADQIYIAIGQRADGQFLEHMGLAGNGAGITADPDTLETSREGVFAGGDIVTGPASVIEAIAAGKRAADSVERYLNGEDLRAPRFEDDLKPFSEDLLPDVKKQEKNPRHHPDELSSDRRINNFDEVEAGFSEAAALAEAERCLNCALCSECGECLAACEHNAIDYFMRPKNIDLDIGSVILAPGFEEFAAEIKGEFGFGRYPNVLTSVQFERMLSAAGPFEGHVVRRSDGRPARRIAWIQCVGSRDSSCGNDYCSSICCMASTKQALIAREHVEHLAATIFYMDIRAHGKDFDQYYERAKGCDEISYIRSIPSRVLAVPGTDDLRLRFLDENDKRREMDFDLVVLAVGMTPAASVRESAGRLGIALNEYGFCATDRLRPLETSRPGVYVAGAFQEPKDIPETVTQASGAAAMSMELLAPARHTLITKKSYPEEHDITDEKPRIGVFICHCGMNIASVVDVESVTDAIAQEPDVVMATHTMYTCSDTSLSDIRDKIREHRLNRIVVASCTPRTHEPLFRETLREAGLNPYLFEMANIRDQCSWVHSADPRSATQKAIDLVRMAVGRAHLLCSLEGSTVAVDQAGAVIGGGLSGMTAALALADQGFKMHLVERTSRLGGNLQDLYYTLEHDDIRGFTDTLVQKVMDHPNIEVYLETNVSDVSGHVGSFHLILTQDSRRTEVSSGIIIVATGANRAQTAEFLHQESDRVITQSELEQRLQNGSFPAAGRNIVMIQCVGSRNEEHAYCSRLCCSMAIKNALRIKKQDPDANIYVLYRDIRTYGFREIYYQQARQAGVVFLRYREDSPPAVSQDEDLLVTLDSPDFPEPLEIEADHVILSTGMVPPPGNDILSDLLKVPLNADGFYVEAHLKLRPVDFATEGIFLCGLAHSPKCLDENLAQARAAAARAATVLSKTHLDVSAQVSQVNQTKCISCMTCVTVCPYTAPYVNKDRKAQIEAAKCMGCGICAAECPARAIQLHHFMTDQFTVMIKELFEQNSSMFRDSESIGEGDTQAPVSCLTGENR
ncbi:MAG: FAD-dependent oxidoreductase [Sedimentisphaerales bacterium]|nr:FAD-dependent oxidoreductase [Sedimentisphaerales bacterium]